MDNGRFSRIAPSGEIPSKGLKIIDGKKRFALPGLIDAHVHICGIFLTEIPAFSDTVWFPRQERAHGHDLPVAVHHDWLQDLRELLDLPFDTLEHITEDAEIDEPTLNKMAERSLPVTTDLEQSAFSNEPDKFLRILEQEVQYTRPWIPEDFLSVLGRRFPHEPYDTVPFGCKERYKGGTDETAGPGDQDFHNGGPLFPFNVRGFFPSTGTSIKTV